MAIRGRYDRAARAQRVHEGCGTDGEGHRAETRKGGRNQACERNEEKMKKEIKIKAKGLPHIVGRGGVMVREIAAACDGKVTLPPAKERDSNEVDLPFSC